MSETIQSAQTSPITTPETRRIRWSSVILWVVVLGVLAVLGWGLINLNTARPEVGEKAPNFEVQFFNGYEWESRPTTSLSDLKGQVVVLNFWASWCVECRVEADLLEASWRQYRDQGVVFLGIAYVDSEPKSRAYLEEFNITYPNAPDLRTIISTDYEITGVPETFLIGKDGRVAYVQIGPINQATLNGTIEQLLAQGG